MKYFFNYDILFMRWLIMKNIELVISEGIKTGKWIDISYKNTKNEITYYWIAINDID